MNESAAHLAKWTATFRICLTKQAAYKLNFALLVVGPALVFFLIKYNLWTSIFIYSGKDQELRVCFKLKSNCEVR